MMSSSGGGRFDRDQAAATFCGTNDEAVDTERGGKTHSDYTSEEFDICFLAFYEISQWTVFPGLFHRGG